MLKTFFHRSIKETKSDESGIEAETEFDSKIRLFSDSKEFLRSDEDDAKAENALKRKKPDLLAHRKKPKKVI